MTLKQFRKLKELSMKELADRLGVAEFSVERYEKGRVPAPAIVSKIRVVTRGLVKRADLGKPVRKKKSA